MASLTFANGASPTAGEMVATATIIETVPTSTSASSQPGAAVINATSSEHLTSASTVMIAVGALLGILGVAGVIALIWWMRRRALAQQSRDFQRMADREAQVLPPQKPNMQKPMPEKPMPLPPPPVAVAAVKGLDTQKSLPKLVSDEKRERSASKEGNKALPGRPVVDGERRERWDEKSPAVSLHEMRPMTRGRESVEGERKPTEAADFF